MGGVVEQDWGDPIEHYESDRLPLILHFRPQRMVRVKREKLKEFQNVVLNNLGVVFQDGPQPTISGSGDGWDDCD